VSAYLGQGRVPGSKGELLTILLVSVIDNSRSVMHVGNGNPLRRLGSSVNDADESFELELETSSFWGVLDVGEKRFDELLRIARSSFEGKQSLKAQASFSAMRTHTVSISGSGGDCFDERSSGYEDAMKVSARSSSFE